MPHKRNPITWERLTGLARVIRGNAVAAMEDVALWHERDISHSSAERIILPDACTALDYQIDLFSSVIEGLEVCPEAMQRNLDLTRGLVFSGRVLLALVEAGLERNTAYEVVQAAAKRAWAGEGTLQSLLLEDARVTRVLSAENLNALFDVAYHLRGVDVAFARLGLGL
jgi:adenylosuccinate lyase